MAKRERSKAYPSYNLQDCVENSRKIKEALGKGKYSRDALAEAMGFSPNNADVQRRISSMVQFGLLEKYVKENSYSLIADRIDKITHPKNPSEVIETLKELFYLPTLYIEIMDKFTPDQQIPKQLANILYRDHGITQSASSDAAKVFLESGIYAGILTESGQIIIEESDNEEFEDDNYSEEVPKQAENINSAQPPYTNQLTQTNSNILYSQTQSFSFALTGGKFAQLLVPVNLTQKDITIIRKQIELLELQIDES